MDGCESSFKGAHFMDYLLQSIMLYNTKVKVNIVLLLSKLGLFELLKWNLTKLCKYRITRQIKMSNKPGPSC